MLNTFINYCNMAYAHLQYAEIIKDIQCFFNSWIYLIH